MHIRNYQMHNVLKVYQRQLTQGLKATKQKKVLKTQLSPNLTDTNKRQSIIDKVTSNVLDKINLLEGDSNSSQKYKDVLNSKSSGSIKSNNKNYNEFSFNVIDENNQKIKHTIKVDKSNGIISL